MAEHPKGKSSARPVAIKRAVGRGSGGSSAQTGQKASNKHAARVRRGARTRADHRRALVGGGLLAALALGVIGLVGAILLTHWVAAPRPATSSRSPQSPQEQQALELLASTNMQLRFGTLSQAHTDSCANLGNKPAIYAAMARMPKGSYLQGSCCDPMDFALYQRQIAALKVYASIPQIPADPYNMPASLANSLLQYDQSIALTPAQQAIYDQAATLTDDHGWCCCQCWAWYAHSGLAKYLITTHNFSGAQVVAVTNLEDCCGGA